MSTYPKAESCAAETHVVENRQLYRDKFDAVLEILGPVLDCQLPDAGFYLWPRTPVEDTDFSDRSAGIAPPKTVTITRPVKAKNPVDTGIMSLSLATKALMVNKPKDGGLSIRM